MDGLHLSSSPFSRLATLFTQAGAPQHPLAPPNLACLECDQRFAAGAALLQHQERSHALPKPHGCRGCGQKFSLKSSLQLHDCDAAHSPGGSSPARPRCTAQEAERPGRCGDGSPYECVPCGRGFRQKQALLQHQQARCGEPPRDAPGNTPNESPPVSDEDSAHTDSSDTPWTAPSGACRRCPFCSETFRTSTSLLWHTRKYHADTAKGRRAANTSKKSVRSRRRRAFACRSCDLLFRSTSSLQTHRRETHSREHAVMAQPQLLLVRSRKARSYPCPVCGAMFVHHLSLKAHCRHQHTVSSDAVQSPSDACFTKVFKLSEIRVCLSDISRVGHGGGARTDEHTPRRAEEEDEEEEPPEQEEEHQQEEEDREFPCPSCPEVFALQWQLKEHVELHQVGAAPSARCSVCSHHMDARGRRPASRRQRLYHCVPCQQGFAALTAFLKHCQEHLRLRVEQDSPPGPGGGAS